MKMHFPLKAVLERNNDNSTFFYHFVIELTDDSPSIKQTLEDLNEKLRKQFEEYYPDAYFIGLSLDDSRNEID